MKKRECGSCTKCCEGWLFGQVKGQHFQAGRPCHFKGENGCTIYEDRPENPCKLYTCEWLVNKNIPEWMKPSSCNVIITKKQWKPGHYYWYVNEAGSKMDSVVLNWLFIMHSVYEIPLRVQVDGGWTNFGPKEFVSSSGLDGLQCVPMIGKSQMNNILNP
jgi:hypothetical protein